MFVRVHIRLRCPGIGTEINGRHSTSKLSDDNIILPHILATHRQSIATMPLLTQSPGNRLILGLMTFGPDSRINSHDEYAKCLDYFQSQGYNEVDTARSYVGGRQEAWTAQAHWKERGLTLATKCYPSTPGAHTAASLKESLNTSLKELGTDCVDIFYLHAADRSVPFEETLKACDEMHKEGRFVQLGLSNFVAFEVAEIVVMCKERGWVRPTIYQGMYNAISECSCSSVALDLGPCG